jgi:mitochondrial fission protein ELM1
MVHQAQGLAQALGVDPVIKTIKARWPWRWLPPRFWVASLRAPGPGSDPLTPPWPDVLIACGKRAIGPAIAIRNASGGRTFTVYVQQPPVSARHFDLVVLPRHDSMRGDNVFVTEAAVHHVTPGLIAAAAKAQSDRFEDLARPRVAVLIGGSNNRYRLTAPIMRRLADQLAALARDGAGIMVTASRRTGAENERLLRAALAESDAFFWDGSGENPYFAMLGLADHIVVTCDSVSMTSEALSTGKPVHIVELEGSSRRIGAFHAALRQRGYTRCFDGRLESWTYDPPDDTRRAAAEIRRRIARRKDRVT